jgi:FAD synthase
MVKINNLLTEKIIKSNLPLVIGYFNCIHLMHHKLLSKYAKFNILTFNDFSNKIKNKIYSFNERIDGLKKYNPKVIYIYKIQSCNIKGLDFVNNFLKKINPNKIIIGSNFKFGSDHKNAYFLEKYFNVEKIKQNKNISTTNIVNLLHNGKIQQANRFLKNNYTYTSKITQGRHLGCKIGYPTINLKLNKLLILPDGVYVTKIYFKNK